MANSRHYSTSKFNFSQYQISCIQESLNQFIQKQHIAKALCCTVQTLNRVIKENNLVDPRLLPENKMVAVYVTVRRKYATIAYKHLQGIADVKYKKGPHMAKLTTNQSRSIVSYEIRHSIPQFQEHKHLCIATAISETQVQCKCGCNPEAQIDHESQTILIKHNFRP